MGLTFTYDPDGADLAIDSHRRPEDVSLSEAATSNAESGTVALDDDDGAIEIVGLKRLEAIDDACPVGDQRVWTGYVAPRDYARSRQLGPVGPNAREIVISLDELNTILGDHIIRDASAKRPRESAGDRLAWLLASGYIDCEDRGKVVYPAVMMDATDYLGQTGGACLLDIASVAHYDAFLLLDDERETLAELFFDDMDRSEAYSATVSISNLGDDDGVTIFAPEDPGQEEKLSRSPADVGSSGYGSYAKGNVYRTRQATADAFRPRDVSVTTANASTATQAARVVDGYLSDHSAEADTVSIAVTLDPADTNKIRRGHRILVALSFAPGLESGAYCRVLNRAITLPAGHDGKRRLALQLRPQKLLCTNPNEILQAHATIALSVGDESGAVTWAHATIPGWFGVYPLDDPASSIPTSGAANVNDGDVSTYGDVSPVVARGSGTVAFYVTATFDGTYELCRTKGTVAVGSSQWRSRPPDRIDYLDPDSGSWIALPGPYSYDGGVPNYWEKQAEAVSATSIRQVYLQSSSPGPFGLWALFSGGIRVYDWQVFGDAV